MSAGVFGFSGNDDFVLLGHIHNPRGGVDGDALFRRESCSETEPILERTGFRPLPSARFIIILGRRTEGRHRVR